MHHTKQFEFLKRKLESGQLAHAYLFSGMQNIGKLEFAIEFAKMLSCNAKTGAPCNKCFACQAVAKNSYPDFLLVQKKEDKAEIEISQIRDAQNFLGYKPYYGNYKCIVVADSELMNKEAQSCFLKTLEEPRGQSVIILVSSKPDLILPTIYSRCQTLKFFGQPKENSQSASAKEEMLKEFLKIASSSLAEKFKYAKDFDAQGKDLPNLLLALQNYFRQTMLGNLDDASSLQKTKEKIKLIEEISNKINFSNASHKLAMEILLMEL